MKYVFLMSCWLFSGELSAQIKDTLYLRNGSKIVGEIKKIKLGVVTFDPDDANDITVQLPKLSAIAALMQLYRIETTEQQVYFGKILPGEKPGVVIIMMPTDTVRLPIERISVLYPFRDYFRQRFSGSASAGFDYTRSSGLGKINVGGTVNYLAKKDEISFSLAANYSITDTAFSRDREDVSLKNNYYFSPTWFGTLFLRTQRNLELGLLRRFQEGLGGGIKFITNSQMYAWTRCGIVLNQEENSEEVKSGALTELFGQVELNFFRFAKPKITLNVANSVYYSLSQSGRIRNDAQFDLIWEAVKDLNISLSAYSNFDSQPATEGSRKLDVGTVFSFVVTF
jgi:uncharacterized protein DUF481